MMMSFVPGYIMRSLLGKFDYFVVIVNIMIWEEDQNPNLHTQNYTQSPDLKT